jgi:hypothetical protein
MYYAIEGSLINKTKGQPTHAARPRNTCLKGANIWAVLREHM